MSLDTSVDVSTYNGQTSLTFRFLATDSAGQTTSVDLPLFVETSTHYTSVTTVPGDIVDADATRILYYDSANAKLIIHDRNTQAETLILSDPSLTMQYGFLTSTGAAFATTNGSNNYAGKSFESGTLVDLGSGTSLVAKGSYVIWQDGPNLYRRDVSAHSAITIGAGLNSVADLASNGAVVYTAGSHEIRLYKPDGTDVLFATDPTLNTDLPLTDGTSVLYRKVPSSGTNVYNLFLSDGGLRRGARSSLHISPTVRPVVLPGWRLSDRCGLDCVPEGRARAEFLRSGAVTLQRRRRSSRSLPLRASSTNWTAAAH